MNEWIFKQATQRLSWKKNANEINKVVLLLLTWTRAMTLTMNLLQDKKSFKVWLRNNKKCSDDLYGPVGTKWSVTCGRQCYTDCASGKRGIKDVLNLLRQKSYALCWEVCKNNQKKQQRKLTRSTAKATEEEDFINRALSCWECFVSSVEQISKDLYSQKQLQLQPHAKTWAQCLSCLKNNENIFIRNSELNQLATSFII